MNKFSFDIAFRAGKRWFVFLAALTFSIVAPSALNAHPSPDTTVFLDVKPQQVAMELQIPLAELELVFGHDAATHPETLVETAAPQLKEYFLAHIRPATGADQFWSVEIVEMQVEKVEKIAKNQFQHLKINLILTPPANQSPRRFMLNYDAVMHQVVTHSAFVFVRNDWESGNIGAEPINVGAIFVDTETNKIAPLEINLKNGDWLGGFKNMVSLGMRRVREKPDFLLLLLVSLLPAGLLVNHQRWANFGGIRRALGRSVTIVAAFAVGHSIALLVGALDLVQLPQLLIEILIAVSILVFAAHAVRPIFPNKETFVAAGFGLAHGLTLATTLSNLDLTANQLSLSIVGFNLGVEIMQIVAVAVVLPWLILLGLSEFYRWIRIGAAMLAMVAAAVWLVEQVSGDPNRFGGSLQQVAAHAHFAVLLLALLTLLIFGLELIGSRPRKRCKNS